MQLHHLLLALDRVRAGQLGRFHDLSKKHYLIDPRDSTAWDLKAVVGMALELAGHPLDRGQAETGRLMDSRQMQLLLAHHLPQIDVLSFNVPKKRRLGLGAGDATLPLPDWAEAQVEPPETPPSVQVLSPENTGGAPSYWVRVRRYIRDAAVVSAAQLRAQGACEHCRRPAPFLTAAAVPFLEVHHLQPLAQHGPDSLSNVLALCPNCHRMAHHGAEGLA